MKKFVFFGMLIFIVMACSVFSPSQDDTQSIQESPGEINTEDIPPREIANTDESEPLPTEIITEPTETEPPDDANGQIIQPQPVANFNGGSYYQIAHDKIFISTGSDLEVKGFYISNGNLIWESEVRGRVYGADNDNVYIVVTSQRIDAIDANTGEFKWRTLLETPLDLITGGFRLQTEDSHDYIYVESGSKVILIDKSNGEISGTFPYSNVTLIDDLVLLGDFKPRAVWSATTGNMIFILDEDDLFQSFLGHCGLIWLFKPRDSNLLSAIDITTGNTLWEIDFNYLYDTRCDPVYENNSTNESGKGERLDYIYLFGDQQNPSSSLIAVDPSSGEIAFRGIEAGGLLYNLLLNEWGFIGQVENIIIYSHHNFGLTQAYSIEGHHLLWENPNYVLSEIKGIEGNAIIGIERKIQGGSVWDNIVGIHKDTGEELWKIETNYMIRSIAIIGNTLTYTIKQSSQLGIPIVDLVTGMEIGMLPDRQDKELILSDKWLVSLDFKASTLWDISIYEIIQ